MVTRKEADLRFIREMAHIHFDDIYLKSIGWKVIRVEGK